MLALILSGQLEVWHIFLVAMLAGIARVFQMPSAQSLVAGTLPADRIGNGAAFNHVGMNIGMLIGPLVGGVLFKSYGPEGAFTAIAGLYFLSGWSALFIRVARRPTSPERETVLHTIIEGLRYVKGEQVLWATLLLAVIIESSGWTFHTTLIPIFARDVLNTDAAGLGLLMFAFGMGALTGSLGPAVVRNLRHVGKLMIGAMVVWHSSILVFGATQSFHLSFAVLIVIGGAWASMQVFMPLLCWVPLNPNTGVGLSACAP
jgi:predicted MFS family arabinose efflux permease